MNADSPARGSRNKVAVAKFKSRERQATVLFDPYCGIQMVSAT
jgi:hypothetical protein